MRRARISDQEPEFHRPTFNRYPQPIKKRLLLILAAAAVTLTGCDTLAPAERAALFNAGLRIAESRLLPNNGK